MGLLVIYQGQESDRDNKPENIVLEFVKLIDIAEPARPHIMVADSYYGSLKLLEKLNDKKWRVVISNFVFFSFWTGFSNPTAII